MNDLPMSRARAQKLAAWLKMNFGGAMRAALDPTPFSVDVACAICCKESGIYLVDFIDVLSPADALMRCVFDASGDAPGTSRNPFPKNAAAFRATYGDGFTRMLIKEANKSRVLRGLDAATYLYKGYGLFQYDLQNVKTDEAFFKDRLWGDFDKCLQRLVSVLLSKYKKEGNVPDSIQAYNGSGARAVVYRTHVEQLVEFCRSA